MGHSYHVMDCSARGVPAPSIQWFKDGQLLNFTSEFLGLSLSDDNTRYVQRTSPCPFRNYFTVCLRTRPEACSTKHMLIIPCQNFFSLQHKFCKGSQESCLWTHWKGTSSVKPVYGEAPMMTKFVKSIFPYNSVTKKSFSIRRICYKHESVLSLFVVTMCYRILSCTESLIQLLNKYNDILA